LDRICELQKLAARVLFFIQKQMRRLRQKDTAREEQQDAEEDVEYLGRYTIDSLSSLG
jgi:hypothetical protein